MKKLVAAFVLGAMLVTFGLGCGSPSTPTKAPDKKDTTGEKKDKGT